MGAAFGNCPKHHIKYRGRCPRCHPRQSSSRPVSSRRQRALIMERLVHVETPQAPTRHYVNTKDVASKWLRYTGRTWAQLSDVEYARLLERSSQIADRLNQRFSQGVPEQAL